MTIRMSCVWPVWRQRFRTSALFSCIVLIIDFFTCLYQPVLLARQTSNQLNGGRSGTHQLYSVGSVYCRRVWPKSIPQRSAGNQLVIRNHVGGFLAAAAGSVHYLSSALHVEAIACLKGSKLAPDLGMNQVIVETDVQNLALALRACLVGF